MTAEISRRSLMKTSALGSLALASSAFTLPFSRIACAAEAPVEEKAVWSSCTVNCGSLKAVASMNGSNIFMRKRRSVTRRCPIMRR